MTMKYQFFTVRKFTKHWYYILHGENNWGQSTKKVLSKDMLVSWTSMIFNVVKSNTSSILVSYYPHLWWIVMSSVTWVCDTHITTQGPLQRRLNIGSNDLPETVIGTPLALWTNPLKSLGFPTNSLTLQGSEGLIWDMSSWKLEIRNHSDCIQKCFGYQTCGCHYTLLISVD